eukprot:TRINITY_DN37364_c0_g1_i1.p1 TRINITY_DN37364_c0_g1~~TRINITY_DN37364_c0_g1_i1.p1  ORF type:complete len:309 (-),score=50.67 TRINITY_DN37364_c0_g1_i1:13-939(-)
MAEADGPEVLPSTGLDRQILDIIVSVPPEPDAEQQPILARQNSRNNNRVRFERNRGTAFENLLRGSLLLLCLLFVAVFVWVTCYCVFFIKAWIVLFHTWGKSCDRPLHFWLVMTVALPILGSCCNRDSGRQRLQILNRFFVVANIVLGLVWISQVKTCPETDPELYYFAKVYAIFLASTWAATVVVPVILIIVVNIGIRYGWLTSRKGAKPETINRIETVAYDADLFAAEDDPNDSRPAPECCCCCEAFDSTKTIKRTPCKHYFHEDCLSQWLKLATTCPICRSDLDEALHDSGAKPSAAGAAAAEEP